MLCPAQSKLVVVGQQRHIPRGRQGLSERHGGSVAVFRCPIDDACLPGNATTLCAAGYQGAMCGDCLDEWIHRSNGTYLFAINLGRPTWLAKVVFSGLRRAAGGLLARRRGLGAGRGGHQEPNRKIRSEVPLALALRATARNRCGPTGCLAACWLVGPADLNSGLATPYTSR